jgi:cytochrome P450
MANDDRVYSNPKEFNPDRFLPSGGDLAEQDPRDFVFGFGQRYGTTQLRLYFSSLTNTLPRLCRACPGLHLAYEELYIAIVQILTVFKLLKQVDEKGNKIEVKAEFDVGGFRLTFFF